MKRIVCLLLSVFILSGCATYKFDKGNPPYDQGYVASRADRTIIEYTVGKDNTVPDLAVAKERFKRRKDVVEDYYKRMGIIQNRFKEIIYDPTIMIVQVVIGVFKLPAIAIRNYKFNHNPKYREMVIKEQEEAEKQENLRIAKLKDQLNSYVQKDLTKEGGTFKPAVKEEAKKKPKKEKINKVKIKKERIKKKPKAIKQEKPKQAESLVKKAEIPVEETISRPVETTIIPEARELAQEKALKIEQVAADMQKQDVIQESIDSAPAQEAQMAPAGEIEPEAVKDDINAVIIAKPQRGYSPLKVRFSSGRSHSKQGRIIAYEWDFGDGDTSSKENPANTYFSTTYGTKEFTVTLTVRDDKGNTATSSAVIEVNTK